MAINEQLRRGRPFISAAQATIPVNLTHSRIGA